MQPDQRSRPALHIVPASQNEKRHEVHFLNLEAPCLITKCMPYSFNRWSHSSRIIHFINIASVDFYVVLLDDQPKSLRIHNTDSDQLPASSASTIHKNNTRNEQQHSSGDVAPGYTAPIYLTNPSDTQEVDITSTFGNREATVAPQTDHHPVMVRAHSDGLTTKTASRLRTHGRTLPAVTSSSTAMATSSNRYEMTSTEAKPSGRTHVEQSGTAISATRTINSNGRVLDTENSTV